MVTTGRQPCPCFEYPRVLAVEKEGKRITAVVGRDIVTGRDKRFRGALFADCTYGDGCVGFLAGADFREGRESKARPAEVAGT